MRFVSDFILFLLLVRFFVLSSLVNQIAKRSLSDRPAIQLTPLMKREVARGLLQTDDW
jgi:hypothetical protein